VFASAGVNASLTASNAALAALTSAGCELALRSPTSVFALSTAKFTNYFKGTVSNYEDIYQIDFFIYAAKFYPTAFIVMLVSLL
ncbi:DUF4306 domain-containing protein, partial [Bacillus cereus]